MSLQVENQLMMLFERPNEPVFFPKGKNVTIDVPVELVNDANRVFLRSSASLLERFPESHSVVAAVPERAEVLLKAGGDDITFRALKDAAETLTKDTVFSVHVPSHRHVAAGLVSAFLAAKNSKELLAIAVRCRETCNPQLFQYALSVAILHRPDLRKLSPPSLLHTMPGRFISGSALNKCYDQTFLFAEKHANQRSPVLVAPAQTANDSDPEHKLAYFREDVGVNLHHWHWHLVYPNEAGPLPNARATVDKDRRGELFYYMHRQILARYNAERFSVGLSRLRRLKNFREPLAHGYYPKLSSASGVSFVGRPDNMRLCDVSRADRLVELKELERWEDRVFLAIHSNSYLDVKQKDSQRFGDNGIDVLGNMVESSDLSPNKKVYGDIHNKAHIAVAVCHDPDGKHLEEMQVMSVTEAAMRDPVFYQVHAYIDHIFREYKHTLPPYTLKDLQLPGISVVNVQVESKASQLKDFPPPQHNTLYTYWKLTPVDISAGLDYAPRGQQMVVLRHLQHVDFKYKISVSNFKVPQRCVVRVFLAPVSDERGVPLSFKEHKEFFIEMDKFEAIIPKGSSVVEQESTSSSVTIPWEQTFRTMDSVPKNEDASGLQQFGYCGCGWPHHMLVPRGNAEGLKCLVIVMITSYDQDVIAPIPKPKCVDKRCKTAVSYCGARDSKYPDRRAMGFPFDRLPRPVPNVEADQITLEHFMEGVGNMGLQPVHIVHASKEYKQ